MCPICTHVPDAVSVSPAAVLVSARVHKPLDCVRARAIEEQAAGEHLIRHHCKRVSVNRGAVVVLSGQRLRGHILRRAGIPVGGA